MFTVALPTASSASDRQLAVLLSECSGLMEFLAEQANAHGDKAAESQLRSNTDGNRSAAEYLLWREQVVAPGASPKMISQFAGDVRRMAEDNKRRVADIHARGLEKEADAENSRCLDAHPLMLSVLDAMMADPAVRSNL
jgi:hypothetical protein